MSDDAFALGALCQPMLFMTTSVGYSSFEEAIEAARQLYTSEVGPTDGLEFRLYNSEASNCTIVEVTDGQGEFRSLGLFKILRGEWASSTSQ